MQALRLHPDFTIRHETVNVPVPSATQILLHVSATAITRSELTWGATLARPLPIPGHDVSGTVLSAPLTSRFQPGDEVFGLLAFERDGAAAEYAIALEEELNLKPSTLSHQEAAAVPLSALTAWQALFEHGGLHSGMRLLVTAAAGGVGAMGVQLGKWAGAHVIGTCSGRNVSSVRDLGAELVVNYETGGFDGWAVEVVQNRAERGIDLILDCVGGETLKRCMGLLRPGGTIISVAEPIKEDWREVKERQGENIKASFFIVKPSGLILGRIRQLIEEGAIRAIVDRIVDLRQGQEAFNILERGHVKGKIVLEIQKA